MSTLVFFKKTHPKAMTPMKANRFAAGFDLFSPAFVLCDAMSCTDVDLKIQIAIPEGYYGRIAPKSSLAKKLITIGGGVIDSDYRGNLHVLIYNMGPDGVSFGSGQAIAQLIIEKIAYPVELIEKETLDSTERGSLGFGSFKTLFTLKVLQHEAFSSDVVQRLFETRRVDRDIYHILAQSKDEILAKCRFPQAYEVEQVDPPVLMNKFDQ